MRGRDLAKNWIITITLALFIVAITVSAFVYAWPSKETDCSKCHGPGLGTYEIDVTATPSKTSLAPGETYTVDIVIGENPDGVGYGTGYWIANSDADGTTGTSTGVYGGSKPGNVVTDQTYTATMTAPSSSGTYHYKVFGQDGPAGVKGAVGWTLYSITVTGKPGNQPPKADFLYTSTGLTVEFTDQSSDPDGTITSWHWDFGDGSASTERNPTHTFPTMGAYTVTLTVTDDKGDSGTAWKKFMVPYSPVERMQTWATQVTVVTVTIAVLSFTAVGIAALRRKEGR